MSSHFRFSSQLILISYFFIALSSASAAEQTHPGPTTNQIKEYVADTLKDPGTAQFRKLKRTKEVLCGEVNGKNSYGGYVGYKRFIASTKKNTFGTEVFIEGLGHVGTSETPMLSVLIEAEVSHFQALAKLKYLQSNETSKSDEFTEQGMLTQKNKLVFEELWKSRCM